MWQICQKIRDQKDRRYFFTTPYLLKMYPIFFSCPAGPTSLSVCQPRMHHSSGCLPDQHHGLWGVCSTHPSTPLLSSWVHLQLWDRCSEVLNMHLKCINITCVRHLVAIHLHDWATFCKTKWLIFLNPYLASPIMAPWRAPFPSTPLTALLLMKLWWDRELPAR